MLPWIIIVTAVGMGFILGYNVLFISLKLIIDRYTRRQPNDDRPALLSEFYAAGMKEGVMDKTEADVVSKIQNKKQNIRSEHGIPGAVLVTK